MELHSKEKMIQGLTQDQNGNLKFQKLQLNELHRDEKNKTQEVTIGTRSDKETRTVLLLGETGSGKTLLMNAFANIVLGGNHSDDFRYMIKDQVEGNRKGYESQTDYITSYLIYHKEGSPINYNLRVIDTPGFGDTRPGYEKLVIDRLCSFLMEDHATDSLHCIGLVEKASNNRISRSRLDTLEAFSSLFSCDAGPFTKLLVTFASDEILVTEVVKAAGIPFTDVYEFDNWPLFTVPKSNDYRDIQNYKYRWENMIEELARFLQDLSEVRPVDVKQERLFRKERVLFIETKKSLKDALKEIVSGTHKLNDLKEKLEKDRQIAEGINWNPFVKEYERQLPEVPSGHHAHNCNKCDKTCFVCEDPSNGKAVIVGSTSGLLTTGAVGIGSSLVAGAVTGAEVGMFGGPTGVIMGASVGTVVGLVTGITSGILSRKSINDCPKVSSGELCNKCKHKMTEHTVGLAEIKIIETFVRKVDLLLKSKYDGLMKEISKMKGLVEEQEEQVNKSSKSLVNLVKKVKDHIIVLSTSPDAFTQKKFLEEMTREIQNPEQIEILKSHFQTESESEIPNGCINS